MEQQNDIKYKAEGVCVKVDESHIAASTSRDDHVLKDEAVFECVACTLCFKSGKACANHEKSRKHKENVRFLERQLEEGLHGNMSENNRNGCHEFQATIHGNEEINDVAMINEQLSHSLLMRCSSLTLPSYIVKRNVIKKREKIESEEPTDHDLENEQHAHKTSGDNSEDSDDEDIRHFVVLDKSINNLSVQEDEETSCDIVYHCTACNKFFKSDKACQNHVKSKKHKDNVQMIENELERCSHKGRPKEDIESPSVSITLDTEMVSDKTLESHPGIDEQDDDSDEEEVIYEYARHGSLSLPANIVKRNIIKKISASK